MGGRGRGGAPDSDVGDGWQGSSSKHVTGQRHAVLYRHVGCCCSSSHLTEKVVSSMHRARGGLHASELRPQPILLVRHQAPPLRFFKQFPPKIGVGRQRKPCGSSTSRDTTQNHTHARCCSRKQPLPLPGNAAESPSTTNLNLPPFWLA